MQDWSIIMNVTHWAVKRKQFPFSAPAENPSMYYFQEIRATSVSEKVTFSAYSRPLK